MTGLFKNLLLFLVAAIVSGTYAAAQPGSGNREQGSKSIIDTSEKLPSMNEFIDVTEEVKWDPKELARVIVYPDSARRQGITGTVIVRVLVDSFGKLRNLIIDKSDNDLLAEAAVAGVRKLTFTPARVGNKPMASWVQIDIDFRLD